MALEFDDRALNIIGNNVRALRFYNDDRDLKADIYLDDNDVLNVGNLQIDVSSNGDSGGGSDPGPSIDLSNVGFITVGATGLLNQERIATAGNGIRLVDNGSTMTWHLETPGTLTVSSTNTASGNHTHAITSSSNPGAAASILASTAAGALTLQQLDVDNVRLDGNTVRATTGDLTLAAQGTDVVLGTPMRIGADNFVSQLTGWRVTYDGEADFRRIYADELHVKAFIADIEQALAGGQIISKSVAILSRDFTIPLNADIIAVNTGTELFRVAGDQTGIIDPGDTFTVTGSTGNDGGYTVDSVALNGSDTDIFVTGNVVHSTADGEVQFRETLYVEDLPGFVNTAVFAVSDWIRLRYIDRSGGGLIVADVWGIVDTYTDLSGGEQSWRFRCVDDGGSAGSLVNAGAIALDYGASGDGWHEITALDSDGPYAQIVTWVTDPSNSANYTLRSRLGNLDGVTDSDFPTIGGWGLYSTSAYLKGDLIAAGGTVVLDDDGISIHANDTYDPGSAGEIKFFDDTSFTDQAGGIDIYSTPGSGSTDKVAMKLYVNNVETLTSEAAYIEIQDAGSFWGLERIQLNADFVLVSSTQTNLNGDVILNGTDAMFDDSSGHFSLGHVSPSYRLDVRDNVANYVARFFNDGNDVSRAGIIVQAGQDSNPSHTAISIRDGDGGVIGVIAGNGSGGTTYSTSSDERTKQDVEPLGAALDKILALEPVTYRGRGAPQNRPKRAGLVAQRVRAVLPDVVTQMGDDLLGLDYMGLMPHVIKALQEIVQRLDALEAR